MVALFVGSTGEFSGKSLICMGLGLKFKKDGLKVGYFKPLGTAPKRVGDILTDEDAFFVKEVLGLDEPLELVCPVVLTQDLIMKGYRQEVGKLQEDILEAYEKLSRDKDVVLIGGAANLQAGAFLGITALKLIERLQARVIVVDKQLTAISLDYLFWANEMLGDLMLGTVLNQVSQSRLEFTLRNIVPPLEANGIGVFGVIPYDSVLGSVSVDDIHHAMGGEVICCEDKLNELVESFMVGAMQVEEALEHFRKARNKAVVVGGDRSDILLAALETSTSCLVLTGNLYPERSILNRARESGVPIIVVDTDTYTALDRLGKLLGRLELKDPRKVQRGAELIEEELDFQRLYSKLGLEL